MEIEEKILGILPTYGERTHKQIWRTLNHQSGIEVGYSESILKRLFSRKYTSQARIYSALASLIQDNQIVVRDAMICSKKTGKYRTYKYYRKRKDNQDDEFLEEIPTPSKRNPLQVYS